jgi:hypothetical protein
MPRRAEVKVDAWTVIRRRIIINRRTVIRVAIDRPSGDGGRFGPVHIEINPIGNMIFR